MANKIERATGLYRVPKRLNAAAHAAERYTTQDVSKVKKYNPALSISKAEAAKRADLVQRDIISMAEAFKPDVVAKKTIARAGTTYSSRAKQAKVARRGNKIRVEERRGRNANKEALLNLYREKSGNAQASRVPESFRKSTIHVENWNKDGSSAEVRPSELARYSKTESHDKRHGTLKTRRSNIALSTIYGKQDDFDLGKGGSDYWKAYHVAQAGE